MTTETIYLTTPGFCGNCGSILPLVKDTGNVTCYTCKNEYPIDVFGNPKVKYTINFNSVEVCEKQDKDDEQRRKDTNEDDDEGPVVDRKCPKCNNDKMSYATLQLRSADEGQTVFYTCTKCKFKETENS